MLGASRGWVRDAAQHLTEPRAIPPQKIIRLKRQKECNVGKLAPQHFKIFSPFSVKKQQNKKKSWGHWDKSGTKRPREKATLSGCSSGAPADSIFTSLGFGAECTRL